MRAGLSSLLKRSRLLVAALICISAAGSLPTPAGAQDITARFLADYGNATVMEVTGNFDEKTPEGTPNVAPRQAVAKEFFRTHKDEYDFVVIFTNFDFSMNPNTVAFHSGVKNDVQGIGKEIFDNSTYYGSNGKLQSTIDMGNLLKLANNPLDPKFDFNVDTLIHETLHRWAAYVKFKDWNGTVSDALLGEEKAHWSFLLDSGGSTLYGNKWKVNGDGTFTSTAVRKYYSPLDLYVMGMIDKKQVPSTLLIDNPAIASTKMPEIGDTISGTAHLVPIDAITAVDGQGERIPNAKDSQKQFKTAFIYVVTPGTFTTDALPALESLRNGYLTRFSILTDGKGLVQVTSTPLNNLPTNPGVQPPSTMPRNLPPNINDGLNWLVNHQQADGSWTDFSLTTERDTAEAVTTLQPFPTAQNQFQAGLTWLGTNGSITTDYLARCFEARAHAGGDSTSLVQEELLSRRNGDGGWGGGHNFVSSPTDTALALKALAAVGYNGQGVASSAIAYLRATQNADHGWSGDTSSSTIQPTATVLLAYNSYRKSYDLETDIGLAVTFLVSKQNKFDGIGGFGNSPSTVYDTSLALMALQSVGADRTVLNDASNYLRGQQSDDGSWAESPFQTALAMRSLSMSMVEPDLSIKAEDISIIPAKISSLPTTAVLSATVWNLGQTDVPLAEVALYEDIVDIDHRLAKQSLAFPNQQYVMLTFSVPVTDGKAHFYYVVVDPDNRVTESNKVNNSAIKALLLETTYDFQVQAADITATPNPVDIGKDVKIAVKVSNLGTLDAFNVPVRVLIDQPGSPVEIALLSVDIPAGGSTIKETTWLASLAGVNLPLTVQVDPNSSFIETDKANNKAIVPLTVNTSTLPNLSVSYKDMVITPSQLREGGNASISVLVKNDGFSSADNVRVSVYRGVANQGGTLLGSQVIPSIAIGQSVPVSFDWKGIDVRGDQIVSVFVELINSPNDEVTKTDNSAFITVKILSLPDLAISSGSILVAPTAPKSGDQITLTVYVQNLGEQEARDVAVQVTENGVILPSPPPIPLISGNFTVPLIIPYTASALTGTHYLTVVVDPLNQIAEQKKDNNSADKIVAVQDGNLLLTEPYFSPNGDGVKDTTDFSFRLSASDSVKILVSDSKGTVARTFSGGDLDSTVGTSVTWDGKNDQGTIVNDGEYQFSVVNGSNTTLASV